MKELTKEVDPEETEEKKAGDKNKQIEFQKQSSLFSLEILHMPPRVILCCWENDPNNFFLSVGWVTQNHNNQKEKKVSKKTS